MLGKMLSKKLLFLRLLGLNPGLCELWTSALPTKLYSQLSLHFRVSLIVGVSLRFTVFLPHLQKSMVTGRHHYLCGVLVLVSLLSV